MDQSIQSYLKPELDEASKVLLRAAEKIEREGWIQDMYSNEHGLCLLGALGYPLHEGRDEVEEARLRLAMTIRGPLTRWNDAPGRTKEEVVAKLRSVALGGSFGRTDR